TRLKTSVASSRARHDARARSDSVCASCHNPCASFSCADAIAKADSNDVADESGSAGCGGINACCARAYGQTAMTKRGKAIRIPGRLFRTDKRLREAHKRMKGQALPAQSITPDSRNQEEKNPAPDHPFPARGPSN